MNEELKKTSVKDNIMAFKVSKEQSDEIKSFCRERDWKLSAFIRVAIYESMAKVIKEES